MWAVLWTGGAEGGIYGLLLGGGVRAGVLLYVRSTDVGAPEWSMGAGRGVMLWRTVPLLLK